MAHADFEDHGPGCLLARSEVGSVSMCTCGVLTVTLQYLSVRFEPAAFRELQTLLTQARRRLDGEPALPLPLPLLPGEPPPVH